MAAFAFCRDKDKVMELALKGQVIEKPEDVLKDPYILEFAGKPVSFLPPASVPGPEVELPNK